MQSDFDFMQRKQSADTTISLQTRKVITPQTASSDCIKAPIIIILRFLKRRTAYYWLIKPGVPAKVVQLAKSLLFEITSKYLPSAASKLSSHPFVIENEAHFQRIFFEINSIVYC